MRRLRVVLYRCLSSNYAVEQSRTVGMGRCVEREKVDESDEFESIFDLYSISIPPR